MNIFKYEFFSNITTSIKWSFYVLVMTTVTLSFYPMVSEDISMIVNLLNNYPEALRNAFGFNTEVIDSIIGYFSTLPITFIIIISSLQAMLLAIVIIGKEKMDKASDFLFTKPITRVNILFYKMLAAITLLFVTNIFLGTIIYFLLTIFSSNGFSLSMYILLFIAVFLIQIFFFVIGTLVAILMKKIKSPMAISMGIVLSLYAFNSFIEDKLSVLIPFRYFDVEYITKNNSFDIKYLLLFIVVISILSFVSFKIYKEKDII